MLLKQDFTSFNGNVLNRKAEIESALDTCSHIKLVVPYTGDGVSQSAIDAMQVLLNDDDLDEERLEKQVQYYTAAEIVRDLLAEQAYKPVHTDITLQKHAKVENPRATYYGIAASGPFPCISSRTLLAVSQQCGLRRNRFIPAGVALASPSGLIYDPDTLLGVQLGVLPAIPAKPVARFPRET